MANNGNIKIISDNKKARFNYEIVESFEAGIVLKGSEVKSIRLGKVNIQDAFCLIRNGEAFIHNMNIQPYPYSTYENHEPTAVRKLLLHKREIMRLIGKIQQKGYSLVPLKLYFKSGKIKIEIALARGKKEYDKKQKIKEREEKREIDRIEKFYKLR
ncbi:MAG: SsrA-binding protein SmpB [Proteobacteria bacterium]|nr:SsrA-binding protein SmpB [Pseudomonadota bacterium]